MARLQSVVLTVCLCSAGVSVAGQISGDTLLGVEIRSAAPIAGDPKAAFGPGSRTLGIDSALRRQYEHQSVATLLSQVSSVFIKSYGFNSLATLSFRGASSAQSAVYWEGVPIMNGATGIADVSLLPVAFSDSISLLYGSSGALGGSGNVGGALLLGSRQPAFGGKPEWRGTAAAGWGSFGQVPASAEIGFTSGRFSLRARGLHVRSSNNFEAKDQYGQSFLTEHAALRGAGVMFDAAIRPDGRNVISLHGWHQAYSRQIPRALFEASSAKLQDDGALRLLLDWKRSGPRTQMYAKAAYMQDWFGYRDANIGLATDATTDHYYGEWGIQGKLGPATSWLVFAPVQYMRLRGNAGRNAQFRSALAGNLRRSFFGQRLTLALNGRAEAFDERFVLLPGIGGSYQLNRAWLLRASVQRSYRMPTLNELYYQPGGNRDLKPEAGWSAEGGARFENELSPRLSLTSGVTAYSRHIRDWIIWLGGAIWTPHNLAAVHSRGLEMEHELKGIAGDFRWRLSISAAYARSTPTESYLTNDNSIGRQIPYAPRLTGSSVASGSWKGASLSYVHSYAGTRYITADESAALEPYHTGNVLASYSIGYFKPRITFNAAIQNIWNAPYAVVAYRPMPGINYLISISVGTD